jgi:hypothetical protein
MGKYLVEILCFSNSTKSVRYLFVICCIFFWPTMDIIVDFIAHVVR